MRRLLLLTALVGFVFSCAKNTTIEDGSSRTISFETHVGKSSRSTPVTSFNDGDMIGVVAYQSATDWATDGAVDTPFMDNLPLKNIAGVWHLDTKHYWAKDKKHTFFGYAPYSSMANVENGVLKNYIVASDVASQHDFMLSIPSADTKDMTYDGIATPATVKFEFAHAMSQVRFSAATTDDYSSMYTVQMKAITIRDISNKGDINLAATELTANPWTNQSATEGYAAQATFTTPITFSNELTPLTTSDVFMLMPQSFNDIEVEFLIHVINKNTGGPTSTGDYTVTAPITGSWSRNKVYHYDATLKMDEILGITKITIGDPDIIEWEKEQDQEIYFDVKVTVPDAAPESTENDIIIAKTFTPFSSPVLIDNTGSGEEWTATVSSIKKEPIDWLTLADDAIGTNPEDIKIGTANRTIYIKTTEKEKPEERVAYVIITRKNATDVVITVRQTAESTAFVVTVPESTGTAMDKVLAKDYQAFFAELSIDNKGSDRAWTADVVTGGQWLKLTDDAAGKNPAATKTGTTNRTIYINATENTPAQDRIGTISVSRKNAASVLITVRQTKENTEFVATVTGATGTLPNLTLVKDYKLFAAPMTIDNKESDREWTATVTTGGDWLKLADNEAGANPQTTKTGATNSTLHIINTSANGPTADRTGKITLTRLNATPIVVTVTQTKENTAFTVDAPGTSGSATAKTLTKDYKVFGSAMTVNTGVSSSEWTATASGSWLKLADNASGSGQAVTKKYSDTRTIYIYAPENASGVARTATITVTRPNAATVIITVTQGKEDPSFSVTVPEASGSATAKTITGDYKPISSAMTINTGTDRTWTAASNANWLQLADNASGSGSATKKTGTADKTLYIYAVANTAVVKTIATRTATVTISRDKATTVTVEVTQTPDKIYISNTGRYWAVGNLVATSNNGCEIGAPTDGGVYFQFGSTIGYKGGNTTSGGTGRGITPAYVNGTVWGGGQSFSWNNDAMVWPSKYTTYSDAWPRETTNTHYIGDATYPYSSIGENLSGLSKWESGDLLSSSVAVGDPCQKYLGGNWHTPTSDDYSKLFNNIYPIGTTGAPATWHDATDWGYGASTSSFLSKGLYANTKATDAAGAAADATALFFPASGMRRQDKGGFLSVSTVGTYPTASVYNGANALVLTFYDNEIKPQQNYMRECALPMRCVQ